MTRFRTLLLTLTFGLFVLPLWGQTDRAGSIPTKIEEIDKAVEAFKKSNFDEAYKLLQQAVKKHPHLPPARVILARLFFAANQLPNGRAVLETAAAENADHPEVYLSLGSVALAEGRFTELIFDCQQALAQASGDRWTAEQKKTWQKEARAGLAHAFESRKDWKGALTHLTAWLESEPKNGQVRQRLARALFLTGRQDDAHTELLTAVKDDPSLDSPAISMGRLCTATGDLKKANEWMEKAVKKEPERARVHLAFGQWLLEQGRLPEAKIHAETTARLDPKLKDTDRLRGVLARLQGDLPAAEKYFEALYRESPADFFATNQLALVLIEHKDEAQRTRALQLAEINAKANQRSGDALATLGWVYYRFGRLEDAEKLLLASISGGQTSSDIAYFVATLFSKRNRQEDAQKLLETALAAQGPFVYRKEAQALLNTLKPPAKGKK